MRFRRRISENFLKNNQNIYSNIYILCYNVLYMGCSYIPFCARARIVERAHTQKGLQKNTGGI